MDVYNVLSAMGVHKWGIESLRGVYMTNKLGHPLTVLKIFTLPILFISRIVSPGRTTTVRHCIGPLRVY